MSTDYKRPPFWSLFGPNKKTSKPGDAPTRAQAPVHVTVRGDEVGHDFHGNQWTGGMGGGEKSGDVQALAKSGVAEATRYEHSVSRDMIGAAAANGGKLEGFQFRIKTEASLTRAIRDDAAKKDCSPAQAAAQIHDALRYTMSFPATQYQYADGSHQALQDLRDRGYTVDGMRNMWEDDVYKGLNVRMSTSDGYKFELQLHTPESFQTKMENHDAFASIRSLPYDAPERESANAEMRVRTASVTPPLGAIGLQLSSLRNQDAATLRIFLPPQE